MLIMIIMVIGEETGRTKKHVTIYAEKSVLRLHEYFFGRTIIRV